MSSFADDGFIVLRQVIAPNLVTEIQQCIATNLVKQANLPSLVSDADLFAVFVDSLNILIEEKTIYEIFQPAWELLFYRKLLQQTFCSDGIYKALSDILGKDLAFQNEPYLTANIPHSTTPQQNTCLKIGIRKFGREQALPPFNFGHRFFRHHRSARSR